jgi:hypothetical protein
MSDPNSYILAQIKTAVWSGFSTPEDVYQMIEEILEEGADEATLRAAVLPEFRKKRAAEKTWPVSTDCDRLDDAFVDLNDSGIIALHNTGMTMSDGRADVGEALNERERGDILGYCFYHGQDLSRAVNGGGLFIAFGDLDADPAQKVDVGHQIKKTLTFHKFEVEWNGDPERRLCIPKFDWKRRGPDL